MPKFPRRVYVTEFLADDTAALAYRAIDDIVEDEEAQPIATYELVEAGTFRVQKTISNIRQPRHK